MLVAAFLLWVTGNECAAADDRRVALVIGNSAYEHVLDLPNPVNDASDIASKLENIGFDVTLGLNLDFRQMRLTIRDFGKTAEGADIVMVYFAGHGVEIDNTNYLIPVNAELQSDRDIEFETIELDNVINALSGGSGLKIVLVDACRNNPFLFDMITTSATRSIGRGLAQVDPGAVLVGYAARSGTLALDGDGRNSPYAQALLEHIAEPGLELGKIFRKVRDTVSRVTDGYQQPFTYGSLPANDIFLVPAAILTAVPIVTAPAATPEHRVDPRQRLFEDYAKAEDAGTLTAWNAFLQKYGHLKTEPPPTKVEGFSVFGAPSAQSYILFRLKSEVSNQLVENERLVSVAQKRRTHQIVVIGLAVPKKTPAGPWLTAKYGPDGEAVLSAKARKLVQRALAYMGYHSGTLDGVFGPQTRGAIAAARLENGLTQGSQVDAALLSILPDIPAIDLLRSRKARRYDASSLPHGLEARLEKAMVVLEGHEFTFDYFDGRLYLAVLPRGQRGFYQLDWMTAFKTAQDAGGYLATISSAAENRFLSDLFRYDYRFVQYHGPEDELNGPHFGLYKLPGSAEHTGGWTWVTGEPVSFRAWSSGHPTMEKNNEYAQFNVALKGRNREVPLRRWASNTQRVATGFLVEIE